MRISFDDMFIFVSIAPLKLHSLDVDIFALRSNQGVCIVLHVGPNNLCYVTRHFFFSLCPDVTFYKTLTSLSTVFIKGHVGFL